MKKPYIVLLSAMLIFALVLGGCANSATPQSSSTAPASPPPVQSSIPSTSTSPVASPSPSSSSSQASTKTITLSLNLAIPPTHTRWVKLLQPWINELNKRTDGRVVIQPYFAQALSPMSQNYKSVVSGIADMGENTMDSQMGDFPLLGSIFYTSTPSVYWNNGTQILTDLYNDYPALQQELKDVKVIGLEGGNISGIATSTKPVKTLADLKGMKLNVIGAGLADDKMKALGASVEGLAMGDIYTSLEKGVVDGTTTPTDLLIARKWGDILKHFTPFMVGGSPFYFIMNLQRWDSLPPDIQKIINSMSGTYWDNLSSQYWKNVDIDNYKEWVNTMSGQVTYLSANDLATADKEVQPVTQAFISQMDAKGYPYSQIYKQYLVLEKKYSEPWPY